MARQTETWQEAAAERTPYGVKARACENRGTLYGVPFREKPYFDSQSSCAVAEDEKTNSQNLVYELRQLQLGRRSEIKDACHAAAGLELDCGAFMLQVSNQADVMP